VTEAELELVVAPWIDRVLNLDELNKAADAVAQYYQSKGFLAQAVIPPQKIESDGVVLIKVLEAKLGAVNVQVEGDTRFSQSMIAKYIAYKNPIGDYVRTGNVEDAIYILNEIPGVAVVTDLAAGENDGEVTLNVRATDTPIFSGSVTASNFGSASTGKEQGMANLSLNNPLGFGDQLNWNGYKTEGTNYHQATYSFPIHESGLRFGVSGSNMNYHTVGDFVGNLGSAQTLGVNLSYPLYRSQATNANVTLSHDTKSYLNMVVAGTINSQYTVHDTTLGFSGNHYDGLLGGGVSTLSLSATSGVFHNPLYDPTSSSNYGQYVANRYMKFNMGLTRNQQIIPDQTILNISVSGQASPNNLDSVEKFYLGGPSGVRAYPQSQGSGDSGAMVNIELQQQLPEGVLGYAFYDIGWVRQYHSDSVYSNLSASNFNANNSYFLSGYGLGAKVNYDKLSLNIFGAIPIGSNPLYRYDKSSSNYISQNNDGRTGKYFWMQAVYKF
jgi:hemolysin activation/secretion protein